MKEYKEKIISLEGRVKDLERGKKVGMAGEEISEEGSEKEGARSIYSSRSRANSGISMSTLSGVSGLSERETEKIRK